MLTLDDLALLLNATEHSQITIIERTLKLVRIFARKDEFAEKVKKRANELGIFDVSININDMYEIHDYLKNTSVEDIVLNPIIDRGIWDTYAIKAEIYYLLVQYFLDL